MKKWLKLLIKPDETIFETMKIINETASQFAIVTNDQLRLLGTVTDGDIRRGILAGIQINEPVKKVMNNNPQFVSIQDSYFKVLAMFQKQNLRHIPVVDEHMRIVDVHFADDFLNFRHKDNLVILMAGGLGTRLRPLTYDIPKPMLKVGTKPILETIVENFIEQGFHRFLFSVNYKKEMIIDYFGDGTNWGVTINYLNEEKKLGTAGALSLISELPKEPFIVMNGDILTKVNFAQLLDYHEESNGVATMCVREYEVQIPYGVIETDGKKLIDIIEKPVQHYFVNAGIYALDPSVLSFIPRNTYYDMPTLFNTLIKNKNKTNVYPIKEYWMDIGKIGDYEKANLDFAEVFK